MVDRLSDHQQLAIDVILGQASADERARFDRLIASDEGFADLVAELRRSLPVMDSEAASAAPPADMLSQIMSSIDRERARDDDFQAPAPSFRKSRDRWRLTAIAASVVAAAAIALQLPTNSQDVETGGDPLLALLSGDEEPSVVVIVYDARQQRILAQLSNIDLPADGSLQLWLIREGEDAPRPLGLLEAGAQVEDDIVLTIDIGLTPDTDTLAVSLEPVGGSPEPGPTGPILYTGSVGRT